MPPEKKATQWSSKIFEMAEAWASSMAVTKPDDVLEALKHMGGERSLQYKYMTPKTFASLWKETVRSAWMSVATFFPGKVAETDLIG